MKLDLRLVQIIFLGCFLSLGVSQWNWDIRIQNIFALLITAVLTQSLFCLAFNIPIQAVKSALITSLGLCIILRSPHEFIYAMAGFFAIGSKYVLRYHHKHFINPANFGLVFIVLFTGVAWIANSQWTWSTIMFFMLGSSGILLLTNLKKIDLVVSFIIFFYGIEFAWHTLYLGGSVASFFPWISNGSLIFFTFFMIADPSSTPNSRPMRMVWVFLIAIVALYLEHFHSLIGAPFFALFLLSPLVPILDHYAKEPLFAWDSMKKRELFTNATSRLAI